MHDIGSVMNRRDGRSCLAQKSGCESEKGESSQTSEASSSIPGASPIIPSKDIYVIPSIYEPQATKSTKFSCKNSGS